MSKSLKDQFSIIEDEFLTAISQGPAAVQAFDCSWSSLQATFEVAIKEDSVDDETFILARQIFTRIEVIARRFLELHAETEAIVSSLQSDLDVIFADLNITELSAPASGISFIDFIGLTCLIV
jgi:Mating-type protein beta 1